MNMKKILKFAAMILALAFAPVVVAEQSDGKQGVIDKVDNFLKFSNPENRWINLGAFSRHDGKRIDNGQEYNETNSGLGYEWQASEHVNYSLGFFENSYEKTSWYASAFYGHTVASWEWGKIRLGITGGLVTGYPANAILPLFLPTAMIEAKRFGVNIGYSPSFSRGGEKVSNDAILIQVKFRF